MSRKAGSQNNAITHGAYAEDLILPHERAEEFELLHRGLIEEWKPTGTLEQDTVLTLANCIWLKRRVERFYNREATWGQFHQNADEIKYVVHLANLLDVAQTLGDAMVVTAKLPELYKNSIEELQSDSFKDDKSRIQSLKSRILNLAAGHESFTIDTQSLAFKAERVSHLRELTGKKISLDERLDARIDKALKRLAQLKTFKQMLGDQTSLAKTIDHRISDQRK